MNLIITDTDKLPSIIYAVQVSQSTMQTIIQSSKSRTTLASGELVMVPIITIYNVLSNKQVSDNIILKKSKPTTTNGYWYFTTRKNNITNSRC